MSFDLADAPGISPIAIHKSHDDWIVALENFSDVVQLQLLHNLQQLNPFI